MNSKKEESKEFSKNIEPLNLNKGFSDNLIQSANAIIIGLDRHGKIYLFNPAAERISGYKHEELNDKDWFETLVPRDKYPEVYLEFNRLMESGFPGHFQNYILTKSGEERFISWTNSEIKEDNKTIGILSFGIDITDQKKAEEALIESEEKYRNLIENLSEGVVLVQDEKVIFINRAMCELTGYSQEDLIGKEFIEFIDTSNIQDVSEKYEEREDTDAWEPYELSLILKNGNSLDFEFTASPTTYLGEDAILVQARDISERKKTDKQISQYQERLQDLATELIITEEKQRREIAKDLHDHVGQLLASSRFQIAALKKSLSDDDQKDKLSHISDILYQAIQDTRTIISDLSLPQLNELGLLPAIEDWLDEHIHEKYGIEVKLISDQNKYAIDEKVRILTFRSVREILTNIIKHANASKVNLVLKKRDNYLTISISDNGVGFDYKAKKLRLTTKGGLGLFSIQERMQDIGGSLEINSEINKGTKVVLSIPLREQKQ